MKDETDRQNRAKIGLLLVAPLIAALALITLRPKDEEPEKIAERSAPPPAEVKAPEPPPPDPPAEVPGGDVEAFRAALLGDDRPKGLAALEERAREDAEPPKRRRAARERREAEAEEAETSESIEASSGGLSDAAFRRTIEEWRGMKSCVQSSKTRARPEESSGALRMALKIADTGDVVECRVFDESNDAAKMVARCVERQVRSLKFPAFEGGEPVLKEAKFVF